MSDYAIETHNITKRYGDDVAVDHLNLRVRRGESMDSLARMARARRQPCECCWG